MSNLKYRLMNGMTNGVSVIAGVNTVDVSRGFEIDSDPSGWTETDTGSLLNRYDNTVSHSGLHSMSVANTATTQAYYTYAIGSVKASINVAFWVYAPASVSASELTTIFGIVTAPPVTNPGIRIYYSKSSGVYTFRLRGSNFPAGVTPITTDAWYRLELQYVQNSSSILTVYNSSGTSIDTITATANNQNCDDITIGRIELAAGVGMSSMYFDDIGYSWSGTLVYPLWPYTVNN